jgi:hypothetical protein
LMNEHPSKFLSSGRINEAAAGGLVMQDSQR